MIIIIIKNCKIDISRYFKNTQLKVKDLGNINKNNDISSNINKLLYIYINSLNTNMLNNNVYLIDHIKIYNYKFYI